MRGKALLWKTLKVSALDKLGGKKKSTWEQSEFSLTVSPAQPHAVFRQLARFKNGQRVTDNM